jgi:hypothetical protein
VSARLSQWLVRYGRELAAAGASIGFLAAGICAVWIAQNVLDLKGDAVLVAFLVVPLLLYLALSGRVREFAAGGLDVKLTEVSREPVERLTTRPRIADAIAAEEGPLNDPNVPMMKTDPNRPQVVTLTLGGGPYERQAVLERLKSQAAFTAVPLLVVLDDRQRVLAYMSYRSAVDLLARPERGDRFVALVNGDDPDVFDDGGGFSAVKTDTLPSNATNAEALETMERTGLDAVVVADRKGRFEGVVERGRVLTRMMLALVSPPRDAP